MNNLIKIEKIFELPVSAMEAWQTISNTNALNRAMALPEVKYEDAQKISEISIRRAKAKIGFMELQWNEYPFEWVKFQFFSILRVFDNGPIKRFYGGVEIAPSDTPNVTQARAFTYVETRNIFFKPFVYLAVQRQTNKMIQYFQKDVENRKSKFKIPQKPPQQSKANVKKLTQTLQIAKGAYELKEEILSLISRHLTYAPDSEVIHIQPYRLASTWGLDREEILKTFMFCAKSGLFNIEWIINCPNCRVPKSINKSFEEIADDIHCDFCDVNYDTDLSQNTELRFSVHPAIRDASAAIFCIGNPADFPQIFSQINVAKRSKKNIDIMVFDQTLTLRAIRKTPTIRFTADATTNESTDLIQLSWDGENWQSNTKNYPKNENLKIEISNDSDEDLLCLLEDKSHEDFMASAFHVSTMEEFRREFGLEVLQKGRSISAENISIMFTDLISSTQIYDEIGDAKAFDMVFKHFEYLEKYITKFEGNIVKTIGDAVMAVFPSPGLAFQAAVAIQKNVSTFNKTNNFEKDVALKIGLHKGPSISINANGIVDYFGHTVNVATRVESNSKGNDVVLSSEIIADDDIQAILSHQNFELEKFDVTLKGVKNSAQLTRIKIQPAVSHPIAS